MQKSLEEIYNCKEEMNKLSKKFDEYLSTHKKNKKTTKTLLSQIKHFFREERAYREELFMQKKLGHSDCHTQAVLAKMLAKRKGVEVELGVPRKLTRAFHTLLIYTERGIKKSFSLEGTRKYHNPRQISLFEARIRGALLRPIIGAGRKLGIRRSKYHLLTKSR
jgi:hypothetical protein